MQVPITEKPFNINEYIKENQDNLQSCIKGKEAYWTNLPNALKDPKVIEEKEKMLDMAFSLQKEVALKNYPMDFVERHMHMGEKYDVLYRYSIPLFYAAIMEELDTPRFKPIVDIFINNRNDADNLRKQMEKLVVNEFNQSMNSFVQKNKESNDSDIKEFVESYVPPEKFITPETLTYEEQEQRKKDLIEKYSK
jgi:hypothetical protein